MGRFARPVFFILRLLVTALIFYVIFRNVDFTGVGNLFSRMRFSAFALALAVFISASVIWAVQLTIILKALGMKKGVPEILCINLASYFYSFLGELTGGAFRFYKIAGKEKRWGTSAAAIFIDKYNTFCAGFALAVAGLIFSGWRVIGAPLKTGICILLAGVGVFIVFFAAIFALRPLRRALAGIIVRVSGPVAAPVKDFLDRALSAADALYGHKAILKYTLIIALFGQIVSIYGSFLIVKALNANVSYTGLLWIFPVALFITMFPVSIYGLGMREGVILFLLSQYGVPGETGFLTGFSVSLVGAGLAVIGGIIELVVVKTEIFSDRLKAGKIDRY